MLTAISFVVKKSHSLFVTTKTQFLHHSSSRYNRKSCISTDLDHHPPETIVAVTNKSYIAVECREVPNDEDVHHSSTSVAWSEESPARLHDPWKATHQTALRATPLFID